MGFDLTTELALFLEEFISHGGMILAGNGSPEGVVPGMVGWLYTRLDSTGQTYQKQTGTGTTGWAAIGSGGSGTPGGLTTQVQFNDAGAFAGDADLTWNKTTNRLGFTIGSGLSFAGAVSPTTVVGGSLDGNSTLIIDDVTDAYVRLVFPSFVDVNVPNGITITPDDYVTSFFISPTSPTVQIVGNTQAQGTIAESLTVTSAATGTALQAIVATGIYNATDGSPTADGLKVISSQALVGSVSAAKGLITNYIGDMLVERSGSASNEYVVLHGNVSVQIGTGYTQSAGPVGGVWIIDDVLNGPVGVQTSKLNGHSILVNNYFNGSPSLTTSAALTITTSKLFGVDATHLAANSYPFDVALAITGTSNDGSAQLGFTTAIQVGGGGASYGETITASKIGTGIHIRDYTTHAIKIDNPSGSPTASIEADGLIKGGTIQPSTAYKSVDGSTGATGSANATNTLTIKNGLVTVIA